MVRYNIYNKGSEKLFKDIMAKYNVSEVIARIMVNRDVPYEKMGEYISPDINKLYNPYLLKDAEPAAKLVKQAIQDDKKIRIIGDYDIDGVMSTYILVHSLRSLGARVDYQIPNRIEDGYGLNVNIIKRAIDEGVELIITCDNGVSAISEIELARENGIDVIVTDHHELMSEDGGEVLPNANYLINPKRNGDKYPFKKLCGAVVAWKFITVLLEMCGRIPHIDKDAKYMTFRVDESYDLLQNETFAPVMQYIEYAAFATIGDVMELSDENRIIVKYGLALLSHSRNKGLKSLIDNKLPDTEYISSYHIGFILGPCINASGRLDSADKSLRLLLSEDINEINSAVQTLISLNEKRQIMTEKAVDKAVETVQESMMDDKVLVIYIPKLHESVAGIVAGRIREKFFKPSIVLCDGEECVKGSARSIDNYNMYEELNKCKDLFIKFGGHPMAAGMSLVRENVSLLRERLNTDCNLTDEDFVDLRIIDMTLELDYITIDMIEELELLEPFGVGNKKPLFAKKNAMIRSIRRIGNNKYFKIEFKAGNKGVTGLYFQDADKLEQDIIDKFGADEFNKAMRGVDNNISVTVMYYPQINEFNGNRSVQIVLSDVVL
ncbi:MAG: single-stranded-DNA-specific exonuclease RecJ [Lachnospiraceae bacterium]|nr:single-stranded-DNA-specific exonuclease RecJ [Lachnospiraceae bacterium]